MPLFTVSRHQLVTGLLLLACLALVGVPTALAAPQSGASSLLGGPDLMNPEALVKILQASKGPKPLILNVGPRLLYAQAHIPGAQFIGPGSDPQSLLLLRDRVKALSKTTLIVLYCGCCPWDVCPNVEPAYRALRSLGFTRVKVLYLPTNLGVDWVYKGYSTERGR